MASHGIYWIQHERGNEWSVRYSLNGIVEAIGLTKKQAEKLAAKLNDPSLKGE